MTGLEPILKGEEFKEILEVRAQMTPNLGDNVEVVLTALGGDTYLAKITTSRAYLEGICEGHAPSMTISKRIPLDNKPRTVNAMLEYLCEAGKDMPGTVNMTNPSAKELKSKYRPSEGTLQVSKQIITYVP